MATTDTTNDPLTAAEVMAEQDFDLQEMYRQKLYEQQAQMIKKVMANPSILAQVQSAAQVKRPDYQPRTKTMIRVPVTDGTHGSYRTDGVQIGSLEMASGTEGDYVEFTLLINGRQSQPFFIHRKELEALTNELQLGRLSK